MQRDQRLPSILLVCFRDVAIISSGIMAIGRKEPGTPKTMEDYSGWNKVRPFCISFSALASHQGAARKTFEIRVTKAKKENHDKKILTVSKG